jgi:serine protease Do
MRASPPLRKTAFGILVLTLAGCRAEEVVERPWAAVDRGGGFRDVVEQVLPSIVFIETEVVPPAGLQRILPGLPTLPDTIPFGMGSGVLFTSDGFILTNNHVVRDAARVRVVLADRRWFEAEVVGRDASTDVAVVRIPGNGFPAARLGDSDQVQPGDWVLALGSPLGLQFSVTAGVVSGLGRAIGILARQRELAAEQLAPLEHFIQTDAALSPGNSGGPLVNTAGEVIGINTAVAAPPGSPGSVGFAIPSNLARRIAQQLIDFGEVRRPYLGVRLVNVTPSIAAAEGLDRVQGAAIAALESGGPADLAGLQPGDVIVEIAGLPVHTVSDLQHHLFAVELGETLPIRAIRGGRAFAVTARPQFRGGAAEPGL